MIVEPINNISSYFRAVLPSLSKNLIREEYISSILEIAKYLPESEISGLEIRLNEDQKVDFQLNVNFKNLLKLHDLLVIPGWDVANQICSSLTNDNSSVTKIIDQLYFEFDIDPSSLELPTPCLFLKLNSKYSSNAEDILAICDMLSRYSIPDYLETHLRTIIMSLPKGAKIIYIGAMTSRSTSAFKLIIKGIESRNVLEFLHDIRWAGDFSIVSTIISDLFPLTHSVVLALDITDRNIKRISFECSFKPSKYIQRNKEKIDFFSYLVEHGWCTRTKKKDILDWIGLSRKNDNINIWPKHLHFLESFLFDNSLSVIWRGLHHVKISINDDLILAKAYLSFGHTWIDIKNGINKTSQLKSVSPEIYNSSKNNTEDYLKAVRDYYNKMTPILFNNVGLTYQAGLLSSRTSSDVFLETNLFCAEQAGISSGQNLLDAGCGLCGPAIDIAKHYSDIHISAVTLSSMQFEIASEYIAENNFDNKIRLFLSDYHQLPFSDETFDIIYFFESIGYSYNLPKLVKEVYRVLKPGGILYIKEPFRKVGRLTTKEKKELLIMEKIYVL